ncbi:hypothetical protein BASA83_004756 [Batrachochytrium salamandrivorans]|nr:hypothetical protein BASA83_004756 [Batrachochytrium salamandrivorans]
MPGYMSQDELRYMYRFKLTALVTLAYHDIHVANGKHVYIQTCIKSLQDTIIIKQHALDKIAEYQMEMANTADDREGSSNASPDHIPSRSNQLIKKTSQQTVLAQYKPTVHEEETKPTPTNDMWTRPYLMFMSESPKSSGITRGSGIPSRTKPVSSVKGPQKIQQATTTVKSSRKEPRSIHRLPSLFRRGNQRNESRKHDVSSTPKSQPKWVY